MKRIKISLLVLAFVMLSFGTVYAENGQYTGELTVSPITRESFHTKKANSSTCITAKLDSNASHTNTVKFRVLNYNDELANCNWISVTEGGSVISAGYLSGRGEAAGDPIIVNWKNGTLLNPLTYTVNGYYIYY